MALDSFGEIAQSQILQWAHPAKPEGTDYYGEDGLLVCGKCHQPRETKVELFGREYTVDCMCRCRSEAFALAQKEYEEEQWRIKLRQLPVYEELNNRTLDGCRFSTAEDNIYLQKCKEFADNWAEIKGEGVGLLLSGPVGCGKTYAAACIANELKARGEGVLITSFPSILKSQLPINDIVRQSQAYDLIVVDDLGAERDTDYAVEIVYQFINERYATHKPMIITTNLAPKDMENQTDMRYKRIYSRVLEICIPMVFTGEDRRTAKRKDNASLLRRIINGTGGES